MPISKRDFHSPLGQQLAAFLRGMDARNVLPRRLEHGVADLKRVRRDLPEGERELAELIGAVIAYADKQLEAMAQHRRDEEARKRAREAERQAAEAEQAKADAEAEETARRKIVDMDRLAAERGGVNAASPPEVEPRPAPKTQNPSRGGAKPTTTTKKGR